MNDRNRNVPPTVPLRLRTDAECFELLRSFFDNGWVYSRAEQERPLSVAGKELCESKVREICFNALIDRQSEDIAILACDLLITVT